MQPLRCPQALVGLQERSRIDDARPRSAGGARRPTAAGDRGARRRPSRGRRWPGSWRGVEAPSAPVVVRVGQDLRRARKWLPRRRRPASVDAGGAAIVAPGPERGESHAFDPRSAASLDSSPAMSATDDRRADADAPAVEGPGRGARRAPTRGPRPSRAALVAVLVAAALRRRWWIGLALTLAVAVDALGADRVRAVMMPSRYTADISLEDAACGYKGLMVIERCFRSLKRTQIKMMPMYHWASRRIEAHVKICVLALLIERIAELQCGKPWHQIRRALERLQVTEFFDLNHRVLMRNELPSETRKTFNLLKIKAPPQVIQLDKQP